MGKKRRPEKEVAAQEPTDWPSRISESAKSPSHLPVMLLALFALALLIRLIYLWEIRDEAFFSFLINDAKEYDRWAQQIAAGDGLGKEVFYQAPLYPYFLAVLYRLLGRGLLMVRLVQITLGSISCVFLAKAGQNFFHRGVGLLAGILLALYAPAVFADGLLQKTCLDLFFVTALLLVISLFCREPRQRWIGLAGLILAGLTLTRENAMLLIPALAAWIWIQYPSHPVGLRLRWISVLLVGVGVVLMPVGLRNWKVGGNFLITTSQFGSNFYIGNGQKADGLYVPLREHRGSPEYERRDATDLAEQALGRSLSSSEVSDYWFHQALSDIEADPSRWVRLMIRKTFLVINAVEIPDSEDQSTYEDGSWLLRSLDKIARFGVYLPLSVLGLAVTWGARRKLWVLYVMVGVIAGSVVLFYVFARYRFPMVPILILFTSAGIIESWKAHRAHGIQISHWILIVVAGLAINWRMLPNIKREAYAVTQFNLATELVAANHIPEALPFYDRTLKADPQFAVAHVEFANARTKLDKWNEAVPEFEEAIRIDPKFPDAHWKYAEALAEHASFEKAIPEYRAVVDLLPQETKAHFALANALAKQKSFDEAVAEYEIVLQMQPNHAGAHNNLASTLLKLGKWNGAVHEFEEAIRVDPKFPDAHLNYAEALAEHAAFDEAIREFRAVVDLLPRETKAHFGLANALAKQKKLDEAIAEYEVLLQMQPSHAGAHNNLANTLLLDAKIPQAISHYQEAIRLNGSKDAERNLAIAMGMLKASNPR